MRPLYASDIGELFDETPHYSMRGIVAEIDGEIAAVAALAWLNPLQAFSRIINDDLRKHPKTIVLMARKLADIMETVEAPVFAISDPQEPGSDRFLGHIGFRYYMTNNHGRIYKWQTQHLG